VKHLSHGSVRALLEIVHGILLAHYEEGVTGPIPLAAQDSALRTYSKRKVRSIGVIPGDIGGVATSNRLRDLVTAMGETSRTYLKDYPLGPDRERYETLSFERNDTTALSSNAEKVLREAVRYNLLIDYGLNFSRKKFGLVIRYDLNKAFAPAFQTTYRVRNHLYLSRSQVEKLALHPTEFIRDLKKRVTRKQSPGSASRQTRLDL
jgi:hypothetical protein